LLNHWQYCDREHDADAIRSAIPLRPFEKQINHNHQRFRRNNELFSRLSHQLMVVAKRLVLVRPEGSPYQTNSTAKVPMWSKKPKRTIWPTVLDLHRVASSGSRSSWMPTSDNDGENRVKHSDGRSSLLAGCSSPLID
jgi:hypothetical protein